MKPSDISVGKVDVSAYTIRTEVPEGDGTLRWDSTTLIVCEIHAADEVGFGYSYGNQATAFVADYLAGRCLLHRSPLDIPGLHKSMLQQVRNDGSRGIASMAISALDVALWDLKAKLLGRSILDLFGAVHASVAAYGSGGFTTYSHQQLTDQLSGWAAEGLKSVKMKIGADPGADMARVQSARDAIGPSTNLFVDANGAYDVRQAIAFAEKFVELNVTWFEEPVSSDDLDGLRRVRDRVPVRSRLQPGSMATIPSISGTCWRQKQSMSCSWTRPAARDSRAFWKEQPSQRVSGYLSPRIVRLRCTCTPVASSRPSGTSNTSTITLESRRCSSMVSFRPRTVS